jgi:hypothetical protein
MNRAKDAFYSLFDLSAFLNTAAQKSPARGDAAGRACPPNRAGRSPPDAPVRILKCWQSGFNAGTLAFSGQDSQSSGSFPHLSD